MADDLTLVDQDLGRGRRHGPRAVTSTAAKPRAQKATPRSRPPASAAPAKAEGKQTPSAPRAADVPAAPQVGPFPFADDERTQLAVRVTPRIWERLESLATALRDDGNRQASVSGLVVSVLAFRAPADPAGAIELARRFVADGEDTPTVERNVRVYEAQRLLLDQHARALAQAGIPGGRSRVVNAIIHAHLPSSPDDAAQLLRAFDLWRAGVLAPDAADDARGHDSADGHGHGHGELAELTAAAA